MYLYSIKACEMEESRRIIGNEREDYVNARIEKKQKDLLRSLRGIQEEKEIRQEDSRNVLTTQCFPNRSTHFTTPIIAFRSTLAPIIAYRITQTHQNPKSFDIAMLYPPFHFFLQLSLTNAVPRNRDNALLRNSFNYSLPTV